MFTESQSRQLDQCQVSRKKILERSFLGTASPRNAIKAFCMQCVGYQDVVNCIGGCTASGCALWAYRPFQAGDVETDEAVELNAEDA